MKARIKLLKKIHLDEQVKKTAQENKSSTNPSEEVAHKIFQQVINELNIDDLLNS